MRTCAPYGTDVAACLGEEYGERGLQASMGKMVIVGKVYVYERREEAARQVVVVVVVECNTKQRASGRAGKYCTLRARRPNKNDEMNSW